MKFCQNLTTRIQNTCNFLFEYYLFFFFFFSLTADGPSSGLKICTNLGCHHQNCGDIFFFFFFLISLLYEMIAIFDDNPVKI